MTEFDGVEWDWQEPTDVPADDAPSAGDRETSSDAAPHPEALAHRTRPGTSYRTAVEVHDHCRDLLPDLDEILDAQTDHLLSQGVDPERLERLVNGVEKLPGENSYEFAQWRQTPEGRSYLSWEQAAKKIVLLSRQRDVLAQQLRDRLWQLSDSERPEAVLPYRDEDQLLSLRSDTHGNASTVFTGVVGVGLGALAWWGGSALRNPDAATLLGMLGHAVSWPVFLIAILLVLAGLFLIVVGGRGLYQRPQKLAELRALEARHEQERTEYQAKLAEAAEWDAGAPEHIGVRRDEDPQWLDAADERFLQQIIVVLQGSRTTLPPPEECPVLQIPAIQADPSTGFGQGMNRISLLY